MGDDMYYNLENLSFGRRKPEKKQKPNLGVKKISKPDIDFNTQLSKIHVARSNGQYSLAYDLADELLRFMDERPHFFTDRHRSIVWHRIFEILEEHWGNAIIEKYNQIYEEIKRFGSYETYRVSHYPKSYEEYWKSAALDELMSLYSGTRYGGYMHVIIMRVLERHFEEEKAKQNLNPNSNNEGITGAPGLPENVTSKEKRVKSEREKGKHRVEFSDDDR